MTTSERGKKNHFKNIETKDFFPAVNGINLGVHDLETSERGKKNHSKTLTQRPLIILKYQPQGLFLVFDGISWLA